MCNLASEIQAMVNIKEAQDIFLHCFANDLIGNKEFILLYDVNEPANPELPYLTNPPFDLKKCSDDECKSEFSFSKNNI